MFLGLSGIFFVTILPSSFAVTGWPRRPWSWPVELPESWGTEDCTVVCAYWIHGYCQFTCNQPHRDAECGSDEKSDGSCGCTTDKASCRCNIGKGRCATHYRSLKVRVADHFITSHEDLDNSHTWYEWHNFPAYCKCINNHDGSYMYSPLLTV